MSEKDFYTIEVACLQCFAISKVNIEKNYNLNQRKKGIFHDFELLKKEPWGEYSHKDSYYVICPVCESHKIIQKEKLIDFFYPIQITSMFGKRTW